MLLKQSPWLLRAALLLIAGLAACSGSTTADDVAEASTGGGSGTSSVGGAPGGAPSTGGSPSAGGAPSVGGGGGTLPTGGGGALPTGGGGAPNECAPGQKKCGGICVFPYPEVGCGTNDCVPCPTPVANAFGSCSGATCDFTCAAGYSKTDGACVPLAVDAGPACGKSCDASDPASQFACFDYCVLFGGPGACDTATKCCVCNK